MKLLCVAPQTVMHEWFTSEPPVVMSGKEIVSLRNCPEHDDLPYSESAAHREAQEVRAERNPV